MKVWNVYDIIEIPDGESWFKANVEFITITDNGKEVRKKQCFLVFDTTLKSARNTLESHLSGMDAKIVSIEETKIVELLRANA